VTGLLATCGAQFRDWSAAYRLFSHQRLPMPEIFATIRRAALADLPADAPACAVIDDSLLRRGGLHTPGVAWRRDPLGPHFQTNLVRAQRCLQTSLALHTAEGACRMVPVSFVHAPTPDKLSPKATDPQRQEYRVAVRASRLSQRGLEQISSLRAALDADSPSAPRPLWVAFDGGYTNATVLKHIPPRTICIGRVRKDAHLLWVPDPETRQARGRRLCYGLPAPTPEQVRSDDSPWETIELARNDNRYTLRFKRRTGLMWRAAGAGRVVQLVVIAAMGYRLRKGSKLLYRQPAFLICTDETADVRRVLETFLQRWDIEVNFREEKTLLGMGEAQVRCAHSVQDAPALTAASYAMLQIATQRAYATTHDQLLPSAKWTKPVEGARISTQQALHQLRAEVWARGLGVADFSAFASSLAPDTKPEKFDFPLASAVCYANA